MKTFHICMLAAVVGSAACGVQGPPAFPRQTTATLAGPLCEAPGRPCRCASSSTEAGAPAEGMRRFEVRLPSARGTSSAVAIEGIGSVVRDESSPETSCFYFDGRLGATYRVRYLAKAHDRDLGITVAFGMREAADDDGEWYDVIQQQCGSSDTPCHHESVSDWTAAIAGGHRFHDRCGTTRVTGMRVDGGLYDRYFIDAQLGFDMNLRHEGPLGAPGGSCRDMILTPGATEGAE